MRKKIATIIGFFILFFCLIGSTPSLAASKGNLLSPDKIITVAHRGASGYVPEHTILSYETAQKMKADYIELDLQMTKDGQLIVMHDEKVDRTTNGTGWVKDYTLADIKKLDAGSWFNRTYPDKAKEEYSHLKVPTLDEVLEHFGKSANYYIETKAPDIYPGMEEKLISSLKKHHLFFPSHKGQVMIQSFSSESLLKVHQLAPFLPTVQLLNADSMNHLTDTDIKKITQYAVGIGPDYKSLTAQNVQNLRQHHLLIHPYTVNTEPDMKRLLDWGVTGVFTNYTDIFNAVKKEYKR
ncbi:glycerophosphodiester phosphodiesterase [Priestia megaterium]|uniref:Glycerophosphodiester phosphodiesterase n=1 Tax=Priestia megaterium TaxID=1404 RepID=A0A3D8WYC6_PRIMG|nr:glycerophosphodiester phosphodiesterase [Priestia megaterium]RDZ11766.1 glycerophosphodiester phosphodiesterase [Priestia megaterium]